MTILDLNFYKDQSMNLSSQSAFQVELTSKNH
jgi:hypothetical protein